jgi:regulator of protease activity HflC (stomatin/prohibitin superfamily)
MRYLVLVSILVGGCGYTIEPGHRGLYFDARHGGLRHDVLQPGWHRVGVFSRVDDFDVTYSTRKEEIHTVSSEGLTMDLKVALIFRPIISELYDLDVEIGPEYYDEVVGPEFRTATRGVFARHSYLEVQKNNEKIEDEVEAEVRRRIAGKHVEISSVTLEEVSYAPEIANAVRAKLVGAEEALRKKAALEADALRQKLELEHEAEREKLTTEAALRRKEHERKLAEEQSQIDRVKAQTEAETTLTRAKAEAEQLRLLAHAHAEEKKAEAQHLTPLMVMMHGYDALAKLGGDGTNVMLGDWSRVPSFLFPSLPGFPSLQSGARPVAQAH